jgi:hypothetical protein
MDQVEKLASEAKVKPFVCYRRIAVDAPLEDTAGAIHRRREGDFNQISFGSTARVRFGCAARVQGLKIQQQQRLPLRRSPCVWMHYLRLHVGYQFGHTLPPHLRAFIPHRCFVSY